MSDRIIKINELVRQNLGQIVNSEVEFSKGTIVTITRVSTSPDLRHARVYISVLPPENKQKVIKTLINESKNLHHLLNEKIILRNIPRLTFFIDEDGEKAAELDHLLDNLK